MKKNIFVYVLLFVFMFVAMGCRPSDPETPNTEVQALKKASLQLQWFTQAQFAGYYVALEKEYYKQEGIELTIHPGGPDIVPVDLVTGGSRDFGTTLLADFVVSVQKGKSAISIAQIQQNNGLRLVTKKKTGIEKPEDLMGKKVGVWLGGWEVQFNALLAQQGIAPDKVTVMSQGFSMTPFIEDQLDVASAMIYNEYYMVLAAGIQKQDLAIIDYAEYSLDFPGDVLFTSQKHVLNDPDFCLRMVRASIKGWQYALENQDEAVQIVLKHDRSGVATLDHQKKMMHEISKLVKSSGNLKIGQADLDAVSKMINLLVESKVLESPISTQKIFTSRFIDLLYSEG